MGSQLKNPKQLQLNPNWAQLREKLKSDGSKPYSKRPEKSETETQKTVLGKRKERSNVDSDDSLPNPLTPTSSDFSLTDTIAMDCEMVGTSSLGNKSALGRVTMVNKWGNVIYDEYVRPVDRVVDFRTEISGIRPRDLRKVPGYHSEMYRLFFQYLDAPCGVDDVRIYSYFGSTPAPVAKDFRIVQTKVAEMIKGRLLVGHALRNDLKALLLSHPRKDVRDTSEYLPFLKEGRSKALRHLAAEFLGVKIQDGEHCSIEDARAAMLLYQKNKKQWEKSAKDFIRLLQKQKKRKQKRKPKEKEGLNTIHAAATSQHQPPVIS